MSCSIHLGAYILVVQAPTPVKEGGQAVLVPSKDKKNGGIEPQAKSALDFELNWLRFLRETEDEYLNRLTKKDQGQPLSVMDCNVDIFELYLLKVSGRALAATQHLNLNMTTAMASHLKIFDTQQPELPPESEQMEEDRQELERRKAQREARRNKRRRITASFNHSQSMINREEEIIMPSHIIQVIEPSPPSIKQKHIYDSLNERDDDDDDEGGQGERLQEEMESSEHEEFTRDDHTIDVRELMPLTADIQEPIIELQADNNDRATMHADPVYPDQITNIHINNQANDSIHLMVVEPQVQAQTQQNSLNIDSIIKTEGEEVGKQKIMIGNQSIDDNFNGSADGQPFVQAYQDEIDIINEDEIADTNPFMKKSTSMGQLLSPGGQMRSSLVSQPDGALNNSQIISPNEEILLQADDQDKQHQLEPEIGSNNEEQVVEDNRSTFEKQLNEEILVSNNISEEQQVIMTFEVAVGTTPINLSLEKHSIVEMEDQAVGTTPMHKSNEIAQLNTSVGVGSSNNFAEAEGENQFRETVHAATSPQNLSMEKTPQADEMLSPDKSDKPSSKLEVTLTAEPDKPIIVEVRGGEKQFLIQALTKHIYDILSQPHRLQYKGGDQILEPPEEEKQKEEEIEQKQPPVKIGGNINLKLKSLKHNLQKKNGDKFPQVKLSKNEQSALTIEEIEQSLVQDEHPLLEERGRTRTTNLPQIRTSNQQKSAHQLMKNSKISSRSSSGIDLSPLTVSMMIEEAKVAEQVQKEINVSAISGAEKRQSKRLTKVAHVEKKIQEEIRSNTANQSQRSGNKRETQIELRFKEQNIVEDHNRDTIYDSSIHQYERESLEQKKMISRPETANFQPRDSQIEVISAIKDLPPIKKRGSYVSSGKVSQDISHKNFPTKTPSQKISQRESYIAEPLHESERIRDSLGAFELNQVEFQEQVLPSTQQDDNFTLPPLQPNIVQNDFFNSDGYEIAAMDSQTFGNSMNTEIQQDEYLPTPAAVTYYDAYEGQNQDPQLIGNEGYYQNQFNVFQEDEQSNALYGEYILAEGYQMNYPPESYLNNVYDYQKQQENSLNENQSNLNTNSTLGGRANSSLKEIMLPARFQNNNQSTEIPKKKQQPKASSKQLPDLKTKKKYFQNMTSQTIYGLNGGPAFRTMSYTPNRSLSPIRKKKAVYYTSNFNSVQGPNQAPKINHLIQNQQVSQDEIRYYSQSPQPKLMRNSPYMSDDEYKILQNFYDIQCEPTGLQRGGVPLMRVKRVNRPNKRTFNVFNFIDDTSIPLPKALSSLQILYPQYQSINQGNKSDKLGKTLNTPNKWFERFYQSTRNLNQTISKLHRQHDRKLRSYSVSSLSSSEAISVPTPQFNVQQPIMGMANGAPSTGSRNGIRLNSVDNQPLFTKQQFTNINGEIIDILVPAQENLSAQQDIIPESADYRSTQWSLHSKKKQPNSALNSAHYGTQSSTFMPPLQKIYTQAHVSHDLTDNRPPLHHSNTTKKNKLPPRPKAKPTTQSTKELKAGKGLKANTEGNGAQNISGNIINANHNQYVCFGVNIITSNKSDN